MFIKDHSSCLVTAPTPHLSSDLGYGFISLPSSCLPAMQTTLSRVSKADSNSANYVSVSSAWSNPEAIHVAPGGLGSAAKTFLSILNKHHYQASFPVDHSVLKLCLDSSTLSPPSVIPSSSSHHKEVIISVICAGPITV